MAGGESPRRSYPDGGDERRPNVDGGGRDKEVVVICGKGDGDISFGIVSFGIVCIDDSIPWGMQHVATDTMADATTMDVLGGMLDLLGGSSMVDLNAHLTTEELLGAPRVEYVVVEAGGGGRIDPPKLS